MVLAVSKQCSGASCVTSAPFEQVCVGVVLALLQSTTRLALYIRWVLLREVKVLYIIGIRFRVHVGELHFGNGVYNLAIFLNGGIEIEHCIFQDWRMNECVSEWFGDFVYWCVCYQT